MTRHGARAPRDEWLRITATGSTLAAYPLPRLASYHFPAAEPGPNREALGY